MKSSQKKEKAVAKYQKSQAVKIRNGNSSEAFAFSKSQTEAVAKLAYQYYADGGYRDGYDREDWLRAEAVVGQERYANGF